MNINILQQVMEFFKLNINEYKYIIGSQTVRFRYTFQGIIAVIFINSQFHPSTMFVTEL
jgi:hypothetical protein